MLRRLSPVLLILSIQLHAELQRLLLPLVQGDARTDALSVSPAHLSHELCADSGRRGLDEGGESCSSRNGGGGAGLGTENAEERVVGRGGWGSVGGGGTESARRSEFGEILREPPG